MNASKAIPEIIGPIVKCAGCSLEIPGAVAIAGSGYCPACAALSEIADTRRKQSAFGKNTMMGTCPKCGSTNLREIAIGPWGQSLVWPLIAVILTALGAVNICLVPMAVALFVFFAMVTSDKKTLKGFRRQCCYCDHKWELDQDHR